MKKVSSNNLKNKNNSGNKLNKKNVILSTMATTMVAVPVGATSGKMISDNLDSVVFEDKYFTSYDNVVEYIKDNSNVTHIKEESENAKWTINYKGSIKTFNDPQELRDAVNEQYITPVPIKTDINLQKHVNENGVLGSTSANVYSHIYDADEKGTKVYLGNGGRTFTNEVDAYMSYFDVHDSFYFDGIYFDSKQDLRTYLLTDYLPSKNNKSNTVVLTSPNGRTSSPIDLSQPGASNLIEAFIRNNSDKVLTYTNPLTGEGITISRNNISEAANIIQLNDFQYTHVQSNQGESRYVVDNHINDNNNLIGPYFYEGVLDIGAFTNKNMWRKVKSISSNVYMESKVDTMIGGFFTAILNDDATLNKTEAECENMDPLLFRTVLTTDDGSSLDRWFIQQLGNLAPKLKQDVVEANNEMMEGKKYNSFNKIPILYSFLMQRAISYKLSQNVVQLIIDYFNKVCDFVQDVLEFVSMYYPDFLISKDGKTKFDAKTFFNIGNGEYDLNTSTEYYLQALKDNYPNMIALMSTYNAAQNNITLTGGLAPFSSVDNSFLFDFGLYAPGDGSYKAIEKKLETVYNAFSKLTYSEMLSSFICHSPHPQIKALANMPKDQQQEAFKSIKSDRTGVSLDVLLSGIGSKNSHYFQTATALLRTEIQIYLETGSIVSGGYLSKLYSSNKNEDMLGLFINYVAQNYSENDNLFRTYLVFVLDKRLSLNVLNSSATENPKNFAQALARVSVLALGSASLVSSTTERLYNSKGGKPTSLNGFKDNTSIPSVQESPVLDLFFDPGESDVDNLPDIGEDKTISVGRANQDGKIFLAISDTDLELFNNDFDLDAYLSTGVDPTYKLTLTDLTGIRESNPDLDDLEFIEKVDKIENVKRNGKNSQLVNPFDAAQASVSKNFNQVDDLLKQWDFDLEANPDWKPSITSKFKTQMKSWWSGSSTTFEKIKNISRKAASFAVEIFAVAVTAMEFAFFMWDLFSQSRIQDIYSYTTADGTNFYWDGGLSISQFMGLKVDQVVGIESMRLIKPIQITLPQLEEFYYFNGIRFYDSTELKRAMLIYTLNGGKLPSHSSNFKEYYSMSDNFNSSDKASTIDELIEKVVSDLGIVENPDGSYNYNNLRENSIYVAGTSISYGSGVIIGSTDNHGTIANNIVENIRSTKLVALPETANGNATGSSGKKFTYPGNYYKNGEIITQEPEDYDHILVDNSANDTITKINIGSNKFISPSDFIEPDASAAENNSFQKLAKKFRSHFGLDSKIVMPGSMDISNYFEIPDDIVTKVIYEVKLDNGKITNFVDLDSASTFLYMTLDFQKHVSYNTKTIYNYNGTTFNNEKEIYDWALSVV